MEWQVWRWLLDGHLFITSVLKYTSTQTTWRLLEWVLKGVLKIEVKHKTSRQIREMTTCDLASEDLDGESSMITDIKTSVLHRCLSHKRPNHLLYTTVRNVSSPCYSLNSHRTRPQVCKHDYKRTVILLHQDLIHPAFNLHPTSIGTNSGRKQMSVPLKLKYVFLKDKD